MPETVYIYDSAVVTELWNIKVEMCNQLERVAAQQAEVMRICEAQVANQADIALLLLVMVFAIGALIGTTLYRAVRGMWEVS